MNRTPFEDELADRLSRLADWAPATPGNRPRPIEVEPIHNGRTRRLGLLAGVAAALVAVVAGSWLLDRSESSDLVATDATPASDDVTSEVPLDWPLVGDEWTTLSTGPADGRTFPAQVWTGTELIFWGGESESETIWTGDGAAYDPLTDLWRDLAPSPLSARSEHHAVWAGNEVLICCGRAPNDESPAAAAYDPLADTWRVLSPPPFDSAPALAVWTGTEMIVTGGVDFREAWAYSPASDEWRELSAPPTTIERASDIAWTGTRVVVWPGVFGTGSGLTYEPATDTWAALPSLPNDLAIWGGSMVWTGDEVIVWGNSRADDTDAVGALIRLDASEWTAIADDPLQPFRWWNGIPGSNSAVWTGTEMLVWAGAMGESDGSTRTLAYDPTSDTWRELGTAPTMAFGPDLLWTGDVALAMTDPVTAIRPTAPTGNPDATPGTAPAAIQGVLPNGDHYEIIADPPLDSEVEGISAGIIIDLDDGTEPIEGPVVGIANFQKAAGDERVGPNVNGTSVVIVAGEWRLTISIYDHVLEALGPDAASLIYDAIVPRTVANASDLPAFDLQAPLRWATDEIPLHMQVQYREFVVRRGCSGVAAACSEDGVVEVVPIEEAVSTDTRWADNNVEITLIASERDRGLTSDSQSTGAPSRITEPDCEDLALCAGGFVLDGELYSLSCAAVRETAVASTVLGTGRLYGQDVSVHAIDSIDPGLLVAVSIPGGQCSENDPDERRSGWSIAFPESADQASLRAAVCDVGLLSAAQRLSDGCHLDGELVACTSGPAFPPDVLDDLSLYPQPTDHFRADLESLLGGDEPGDLIGWHIIVEEQTPEFNSVQLLLRADPSTGEIQYVLDGSDEIFDEPRACNPRPFDADEGGE